MSIAREFWKRIETLHAVTYFAPDSTEAAARAGLRGFWMGYFGFRAAPLGPVGPGVVEAAFANFAPAMVRRSIPDAWTYAEPTDLVGQRAVAAARALRRVCPDIDSVAAIVDDRLRSAIDAGGAIGRPMFAANRDVREFDDPVARLWQHCTTLREHRGDGHVIALAAAEIDGCEAHQLLIARQGLPVRTFRDNRGWTADEWDAASDRLRGRTLVVDGHLSAAGRDLSVRIEALTDELALEPLARAWGEDGVRDSTRMLTAVAAVVSRSGVLPYPNPMALPSLEPERGSPGRQSD